MIYEIHPVHYLNYINNFNFVLHKLNLFSPIKKNFNIILYELKNCFRCELCDGKKRHCDYTCYECYIEYEEEYKGCEKCAGKLDIMNYNFCSLNK